MRWRDLKIGKKLAIGFGLLLALFIVAGAINYSSFTVVGSSIGESQAANDNKAFMVAKEVDHLNWVIGLGKLFLDKGVTSVQVQMDPTKCGLGKWLNSEATRQLAADDPELATLLAQLAGPHKHLHNSAAKIDEAYSNFDMELQTLLANRWIDHLTWVKELANSIIHEEQFSGGVDPHKCHFGKWYYAYKGDNADFAHLMQKWEDPHLRLHESAIGIVAAERSGDFVTARKIYEDQTLAALGELGTCYAGTVEWIDAIASRQNEALQIYQGETQEALEATKGGVINLIDHFAGKAKASNEEMHATIGSSVSLMIILSIFGVLVGLLAAYFITRGVAIPIRQVVGLTEEMNGEFVQFSEVIEAISNNDLTRTIEESEIVGLEMNSQDEVGMLAQAITGTLESKKRMGTALSRMIVNLTGMIRQLTDNASQLVSAAGEIASASEEMAAGANNQTDQAAQVSTAIEEMTATILESSKNANVAKEMSEGAAVTSGEGQRVVGDTISGMVKIAASASQSGQVINELAAASDRIGEIIGVIDDIADQTNLLALNAAIEAARAGEQGRGFAVVADEVRKLAERTGKATGEITEMIKGIQNDSSRAVSSMEEAGQLVEEGKSLADQAGNSLNEINAISSKVMDMIIQIATAADQQSAAAEQISKNMEYISSVTKQTAAGAEQSASAAEELNRQAEGLQQMVVQFKIKVD